MSGAVALGVDRRDRVAERALVAFLVAQFLAPALLMVPQFQAMRPVLRALPYLLSLGILFWCLASRPARRLPRPLVIAVLGFAWLTLSLLHPSTAPVAGFAQWVFQLSIIAPAIWAVRLVRDGDVLDRLLRLFLVLSGISAGVGLLQVYFPAVFMPGAMTIAELGGTAVETSLFAFRGSEGQLLIRPPGLSDLPGGAAIGGMFAGLLGLGLAFQSGRTARQRGIFFFLAAVGIVAVYLTQVRSLFLVLVGGYVIIGYLTLRRGPVDRGLVYLAAAPMLVGLAFVWAVSVGGEVIARRFLGLYERGLLQAYETERGYFIRLTLEEIERIPLGAGVGRWGMMSRYFGGWDVDAPDAFHVEIQITGWVYDGGLPLLLLYGGAIGLALLLMHRRALRAPTGLSANAAIGIFALCAAIVAQMFAGPVFNTMMGMQFWFFAAGLLGLPAVAPPGAFNAVPDRRRAPATLRSGARAPLAAAPAWPRRP